MSLLITERIAAKNAITEKKLIVPLQDDITHIWTIRSLKT